MNVQIRSSSGISLVPIESSLMTDRKVFVEGEINPVMACEFLKKIMYLNSEDSEKPIDVMINTPGGEINSGMLMYDVIQSSKAPVRLFCVGRAYSMGAILFAGGKNGRYMLPNSEVMIHEVRLGDRISGASSSIKSISDSLIETKRKMNRILAKHTGKTEKEIEKESSYDHYLDAEECVKFGICDEIISFDKLMEV